MYIIGTIGVCGIDKYWVLVVDNTNTCVVNAVLLRKAVSNGVYSSSGSCTVGYISSCNSVTACF